MKNEGKHEESVLIRYLFIAQHLLSTYCLPGYMLEIRDKDEYNCSLYCHIQWFSNFHWPKNHLRNLVKMRILGIYSLDISEILTENAGGWGLGIYIFIIFLPLDIEYSEDYTWRNSCLGEKILTCISPKKFSNNCKYQVKGAIIETLSGNDSGSIIELSPEYWVSF